ncbi:NADPH-dependent FMN reductase [Sinomicrobium weinanense]|uniref:NAD(P)H-dependent oxidoreductase n=1 Tax=Sinomicrobium weinanense TaxID=2842200 RepID=A0A926Q484_9FLAO|nr:NADPH-dependent FMN reductase [Sinomicrobium weinanense]MBC9797679.1 NAD(P)H-dependent oxidoreductase [Sinomicrobium weinanense]MBU3125796.1 NAD(P)H-dependent oxidoreductase [Sinomicrobium weinanense]
MKTTIVLGSVRNERQSHQLARYIQQQLANKGIGTDLVDLSETPLPIFGQQGADTTHVASIRKQLEQGDALIFVSPEYQGSFSGALKNMIDYYKPEFQQKPIGVATASSGKMGGINASSQLQHVILSLGAYPLPRKLLVPEIHQAFDDNLSPINDSITDHTHKFLEEFLWYADAIYRKKKAEETVMVTAG